MIIRSLCSSPTAPCVNRRCSGPTAAANSRAARTRCRVTANRAGLTGAFAVTIAADEVRRPKPEPDMYLEACARLQVPPGRALAFEDSVTGMRSAVVAGLRLISIPTLNQPGLPGDWIAGWRPNVAR